MRLVCRRTLHSFIAESCILECTEKGKTATKQKVVWGWKSSPPSSDIGDTSRAPYPERFAEPFDQVRLLVVGGSQVFPPRKHTLGVVSKTTHFCMVLKGSQEEGALNLETHVGKGQSFKTSQKFRFPLGRMPTLSQTGVKRRLPHTFSSPPLSGVNLVFGGLANHWLPPKILSALLPFAQGSSPDAFKRFIEPGARDG